MRKMPVDTSHRSSSSTSLPFPHDPPVFPFDPQHNPNQVQHLPHDVLMPSMVGKARKSSGNHRTFHPPSWSEILLKNNSSDFCLSWFCFTICPNSSRNLEGWIMLLFSSALLSCSVILCEVDVTKRNNLYGNIMTTLSKIVLMFLWVVFFSVKVAVRLNTLLTCMRGLPQAITHVVVPMEITSSITAWELLSLWQPSKPVWSVSLEIFCWASPWWHKGLVKKSEVCDSSCGRIRRKCNERSEC